ncbi:trypsin-like peptidase domain-containing protein [Ancylobacter sonchi]|uniref:S1C family serine protease n=1 Tax=Ancylobacter sonchi TaxID=1937790 RepID=UPI001BD2C996|nr:serine protease [Ancylobacter sonchi]MBS7532601.1 trypsin-like peptidase domain-containing protein [Ancylobacter sonchi]
MTLRFLLIAVLSLLGVTASAHAKEGDAYRERLDRFGGMSGGRPAALPAMSEKQKRAAFVPFARAASDCIAREVGDDYRFVDAVFARQVPNLIPDAISRCGSQLVAMGVAHERLYGPGTGRAFLLGPYVEGLNEAVAKRLEGRVATLYRLAGGEGEGEGEGAGRPAGPLAFLVLASREDIDAAIPVGRAFRPDFPRVFVARASNGRYAVVLGPVAAGEAAAVNAALKRGGKIPMDSFVSDGSKLSASIWDASLDAGTSVAATPPAAGAAPDTDAKRGDKIASGSGFFVSGDGLMLTNAHVAGDCRSLTVRPYGPAQLVQKDGANDLAVIRVVGATPKAVAAFREEPVRLGSSVMMLGYPLSNYLNSALNVTAGMVSSLSGIDGDTRYLQFTAPTQPGNSGGPLLDNTGRVVGVATAKLSDLSVIKVAGTVPQNVNFALGNGAALAFLRAAGVPVNVRGEASEMKAEDIAETGAKFTAQIICER